MDCAVARLRGSSTNLVQIEHMDALRLMERYDNADVLMYLDPPYLRSTRKSGRLYHCEMDDAQHIRMLEIATASKAKIIISGYDSGLYARYLDGWHTEKRLSQITSTEKATETLWMNYEPPARQITFETIMEKG